MYTNYPEIKESSYEELNEMSEDYISEMKNTLIGAELTPKGLEMTLGAFGVYLDEKHDIYDIIDSSPIGTVVRLKATFMDILDFAITGTTAKSSGPKNGYRVLNIDNIEEE